MPGLVRKKKREETRTTEEVLLQGAVNSNYTLMQPMVDAEYVRIKNPVTLLSPVFRTDSESFRAFVQQLCAYGLSGKISSEFDEFELKYDARWAEVKKFAMHEELLTEGK